MEKSSNSRIGQRTDSLFLRASQMVALLLGIVGGLMVLSAFDDARLENERLLQGTDVVFGLSVRFVLFLASVSFFLAAFFLLVTRDLVIKAMILVWVTSNCLAYRVGFGSLSHGEACAPVTLMAHKMGVASKCAGDLLGVLLIGCVSLGFAMLAVEWQRFKQVRKSRFIERYRLAREKGTSLSK